MRANCTKNALSSERCGSDAEAKDLPAELLDSRNRLLGAQQVVTRKRDDACHADLLSDFNLNTSREQRDAARPEGPPGLS